MKNLEKIQISSTEVIGTRLDHFLTKELNSYTRSQIQFLIRSGDILVNDKNCKTG